MSSMNDFSNTKEEYWETVDHAELCINAEAAKKIHLRHLLADTSRNEALFLEDAGFVCDFSRQKVSKQTLDCLLSFADKRQLKNSIRRMFAGEAINATEHRAVMHFALRADKNDQYFTNGKNVVPEVLEVLDAIEAVSQKIRDGAFRGSTGKLLTDVICVGIGGSYLGPEFVYEALRTDINCAAASAGRRLRFLVNVDPVDVKRATEGLNPETTIVIVISKTFTTAETMLNARTLKAWLLDKLPNLEAISHHMLAVSTNVQATTKFGILPHNVFPFWDWVGGRYSVCSAVGCLPLAIHYGMDPVRQFLQGCRSMDQHFVLTPLERNIPAMAGLVSVWNSTYLGYGNVAVLPYCQALHRMPAHIQQLTMESNGKRVTTSGKPLPHYTGEVFFGEPGTNGQHSFYQLLHQGQVVPAEFIGFIKNQYPIFGKGEILANHDEFMSNFFAQPDALALGKSEEECRKNGDAELLVPHKVFEGDRPSTVILLPECNPFNVGRLLAFYEHRTATQGFLWGINSFDQWGVELGKALAANVRDYLIAERSNGEVNRIDQRQLSFLEPTRIMLKKFLEK